MSAKFIMSQGKRCAEQPDYVVDNDSDKDSTRKSRNLSEKKRRDQFNHLVKELSSLVSTGSRKMDKSTVLKATISLLRAHNEVTLRSRIHEIHEDWKPGFLSNEEFTHLILEAVDGFIIAFRANGEIFYVSENVTSLLGHVANDVLGMTLFELTSADARNDLYNVLLRSASSDERQLSFSCRLRRGSSDSPQQVSFELVHFTGYFRPDSEMDGRKLSNFCDKAGISRLLFVGTGKLHTPQLIKEMPLVDSHKSEFSSRHSLEWKFLFLDHRAPPIIGYLPFELLGTSGYDYYHVDDLEHVLDCHDALMQKGEGTSCYYRFLTKGQQWIWLQTQFYITYHQWNNKPEFVFSTHRLVSYVDLMTRRVREDRVKLQETSFEHNSSGSWIDRSCMGQSSSDYTSMSASSSSSRHSPLSQNSLKSIANAKNGNLGQSGARSGFLDPPQYVTAIPIPMKPTAGCSAPAVLPPLLSQLEWEKKHAELQAIITQQQAELRRVSEQLLVAQNMISGQSQEM